ncbi:unnamed protein product, partial [Phaeothamnion confervicola]
MPTERNKNANKILTMQPEALDGERWLQWPALLALGLGESVVVRLASQDAAFSPTSLAVASELATLAVSLALAVRPTGKRDAVAAPAAGFIEASLRSLATLGLCLVPAALLCAQTLMGAHALATVRCSTIVAAALTIPLFSRLFDEAIRFTRHGFRGTAAALFPVAGACMPLLALGALPAGAETGEGPFLAVGAAACAALAAAFAHRFVRPRFAGGA